MALVLSTRSSDSPYTDNRMRRPPTVDNENPLPRISQIPGGVFLIGIALTLGSFALGVGIGMGQIKPWYKYEHSCEIAIFVGIGITCLGAALIAGQFLISRFNNIRKGNRHGS